MSSTLSNAADESPKDTNFKSICFKIILIGQSSTGKTSLIRSYIHGDFRNDYQVTVGVDFSSKTLKVLNKYVQLQIWDTVFIIKPQCGQDVYQSITKSFYRGASAAFLVFAIDNRRSFENLSIWLQQFKEECNPCAFVFLIGNKVDLQRQVTPEEANQFLKKYNGYFYIQTSSLKGENVNKLFKKAAEIMCKAYEQSAEFKQLISPKNELNFMLSRKSTINFNDNVEEKYTKSCCK